MTGRVIKSFKDQGYGFIKDTASDNVYFCHFTNTDDGSLSRGVLVNYRVAYDYKKDCVQAKDVKVIQAQ